MNLLKATHLVEKTMPCTLQKLSTWLVVCFAFLATTLTGAGTGLIVYAFGLRSDVLAEMLAATGFMICGYLLMKLRGSIFVPLRVGHVRVLLQQMDSEAPITRHTQLQLAKATVQDYFQAIPELAILERKIRQVLREIYAEKLNIDRFSFNNPYLKKLLHVLIGILVAFVAEAILAYAIASNGKDAVAACRTALTFFTREIDRFSKPVGFLTVFMYSGWIFFIIVMLFPISWLTGMLPFAVGIWNIVFAMVFAWAIKAAILESIAIAAFIPLFLENFEVKQPDSDTVKLISELSDDYF